MAQFCVGDKVVVNWPTDKAHGKTGVIVKVREFDCLVKLKDFVGHNGNIQGATRDHWYVEHRNLRRADYSDGSTVLPVLPVDAQSRKDVPVCSGVLDYFPAALAEVARVSKKGNDQHNPGQEMHWARGKSADHADCISRHLMERGTLDSDGTRHSAKLAWRALALLQMELEASGAPMARGAK